VHGIGKQRERLGGIAVIKLCANEGEVQEGADRKAAVEILGDMVVMAVPAMGMPMRVIMLMAAVAMVFVTMVMSVVMIVMMVVVMLVIMIMFVIMIVLMAAPRPFVLLLHGMFRLSPSKIYLKARGEYSGIRFASRFAPPAGHTPRIMLTFSIFKYMIFNDVLICF
jgi:hypothetical protein